MRMLVTGATGHLGSYVVGALTRAGRRFVAWGRTDGPGREGVDLDGPDVESRLDAADPEVVLHLAAVSAAEAVRLDPDRGRRVNVEATARLAAWCDRRGRRIVFTSTDLVFDGSRAWNKESDPAQPILAYGRTKREAEPAVLAVSGGLVARVSLLYGLSRSGREAFFDRTLNSLRRGEPQALFEDEYRTPLPLATAASALIGLAGLGATGIVHVAGPERLSRFDLIRRAAVASGLDPALVRPNRRADLPSAEPRPADVSLDTTRLVALLPGLARPTIEQTILAGGGLGEIRWG